MVSLVGVDLVRLVLILLDESNQETSLAARADRVDGLESVREVIILLLF